MSNGIAADLLGHIKKEIFIIAEVGNNHNGDFALAKDLLIEAADCGANAIKFQTFNTEKWFTRDIPAFARAAVLGYKRQFDRLKDMELSREKFYELCELANRKGIIFLSTPFDEESVDLLDPLVPVFKVASADLINIQLLRYIASKGKPVILSTGQAIPEEIDEALKIVSPRKAALMHCVSAYPTPDDQANLRSIAFLRSRYPSIPIGYSDHTVGTLACITAAALGARIIEKHFTFDKTQNFGDHPLSADHGDMKELVSEIRRLGKMLGAEEKKCQESEMAAKHQLRRSLHARYDLTKGTVLKESMLIPLVSGKGIPANMIGNVVNKKLLKDLQKREPVTDAHITGIGDHHSAIDG